MAKYKHVNKSDILTKADRGETPSIMEPLLLSSECRRRRELEELAFNLGLESAKLRNSLPPGAVLPLAELVRSMNCYYSNLIEGHNTHPIEIERALKGDYSKDKTKRNLQLEAKAHIAVQQWIDQSALCRNAATAQAILEIHNRFSQLLPDDLLWVEDPKTKIRAKVVPGVWRDRDVRVGTHIAVSPGALPRFLSRFEAAYNSLGKLETVLSAAAAHHRLLWIHPFLDGNGRVARLMSYAQLLYALDTGGVWSLSRGLARNVNAYKDHLANCDQPRRSDLDGRGNLSEGALGDFTKFFLETCLDQVIFMQKLLEPGRLRHRILRWAEEEMEAGQLPAHADHVIGAILNRPQTPRGDIPELIRLSDRHTRRLVASLLQCGVLSTTSPRGPLRLAFPAALASRWLPGLFPDAPVV